MSQRNTAIFFPSKSKTQVDIQNKHSNVLESSKKKSKNKGKKDELKKIDVRTADPKDLIKMMPGRQLCDCEARTHRLVTNCLSCGRIVCEQEGAGPCLFCGEPVYPPNWKGEKQPADKNLAKAHSNRDRLLQYDRENARRTKVIDDQSDYFAYENERFMTPEERQKAKQMRKHLTELRNTKRSELPGLIAFDAKGNIIHKSATEALRDQIEKIRMDANETMENAADATRKILQQQGNNCMPACQDFTFLPQFESIRNIEEEKRSKKKDKKKLNNSNPGVVEHKWQKGILRVQTDINTESGCTQVSTDMCLSVRQPYASMIVMGIKRFEGRTWYTDHRGLLWICSGNKSSDAKQDIEIENVYRILFKKQNGLSPTDDDCVFPEQYQTGVLLGCVDIIDCLPQEIYRLQYPDGECEDPYVLILENPTELSIKFPIQPGKKLFQLDAPIAATVLRMIGHD